MRITNFIINFCANRYLLFIFGIVLSIISSLEVLDANSNFWTNDEGKFFEWAKNDFSIYGETVHFSTKLRYGFFISSISLYFLIFKTPIYIVILHKILIIFIFIFSFSRYLISNYGIKIFLFIFFSLNYLNLFFLRESLLALFGLSFLLIPKIITKFKRPFIQKYNYLFANFSKLIFGICIFFSRPHIIFVYLAPKISVLFAFIFGFNVLSLHFYHRNFDYSYQTHYELTIFLLIITILSLILTYLIYKKFTNIYIFLPLFCLGFLFYNSVNFEFFIQLYGYIFYDLKLFFKTEFFYNYFFSLYSINPFTKIIYYLSNELYLKLILLVIPSIAVILFLIQIFLSVINYNFRFEKGIQLFFGVFVLVCIYSITPLPGSSVSLRELDVRIFLSTLLPFFIYMDQKLFSLKVFLTSSLVLSIPLFLKLYKLI